MDDDGDDIKRYPSSAKEPASQIMDWNVWRQALKQFDDREIVRGRIAKGDEIFVRDLDVLNMGVDQLDQYMDWYENKWLDTGKGLYIHIHIGISQF